MRKKITDEEWKLYIEEHTINKLSLKTLQLKYNLKYNTIYYGLIRFGVVPDTSLTTLEERRTNDVVDDYFNIIDSEEKADILGFLIADGCVDSKRNRITMKLKEEDKDHLQRILSILSTGYKLYKVTTVLNGKTFNSYKMEIRSSQIVNALAKLGIVDRKTGVETLPTLSKELMPHLIRGIFDGDGSISFRQRGENRKIEALVNICSTNKAFLEDIGKYVVGSVYTEKRPGMDMYRLTATSRESAFKFLTYMYENSTISLQRKFDCYSKYANTVVSPND